MNRKAIKIFGRELISWGEDNLAIPVSKNPNQDVKILPPNRVSSPTHRSSSILGAEYNEDEKIIDPVVWLEFIPLIRKYIYSNPNLEGELHQFLIRHPLQAQELAKRTQDLGPKESMAVIAQAMWESQWAGGKPAGVARRASTTSRRSVSAAVLEDRG